MIAIRDLHFNYKSKPVFKGISLTLEAGHIYGLLGKNGTGKSTLLRSIAGLLKPRSGSLSVLGYSPFQRKPAFLQKIFLVPEEFFLPDIPVKSYISLNAVFYPEFNHVQMKEYLKEFDIPVDNSLQQMSYGQKKKVLISFGLACNPKVLLMDEPTNGLDIVSKGQFRKVIAGALDEGRCIVISTHQVRDLESLIDRITIIDEGSILFDQDIDNIQQKLICRFTTDTEEINNALYAEQSLNGNSIITINEGAEENKPDLEMLYKAIVLNGDAVRSAFK